MIGPRHHRKPPAALLQQMEKAVLIHGQPGRSQKMRPKLLKASLHGAGSGKRHGWQFGSRLRMRVRRFRFRIGKNGA